MSSYLALKLGYYINKTYIHKVELKTLYFNFVWRFLRSISRKWKTIKVLSFSRTVNQLIMRVHKPKVEYKLALQEKPQGSNLDVLL